eukprot:436236_1
MGNQHSTNRKYEDNSNLNSNTKLCAKWITTKTNIQNTKNTDDFIIKYHHLNVVNNNKTNIEPFDQRRVIFISIIGLYQSWRECPSFVLYSAIFLLPLRKQWIYDPAKYISEIQSNFVSQFSSFSSDSAAMTEFIKLLKWKDSQDLAFWLLDDYNKYKKNTSIHPFWQYFSEQLNHLYDPTSNNKYNPLNFDEKQ